MQLKKLFAAGVACLAMSGFAQTQPASPSSISDMSAGRKTRVLTMEECIALALKHNLDIQIQRYNPLIDQYSLDGLYSAYDPTASMLARRNFTASPGGIDPSTSLKLPTNERTTDFYTPDVRGVLPFTGLQYDISAPLNEQTANTFPGQYNSSPTITLRQPILRNAWIDNDRYQILLGKNTLKVSEQNLRLQIMQVVTATRSAYYNLVFARENVKVNSTALELANKLLAENKKRVEVGALAPLSEKQAQSQAAVSHADLLSAEQTLSVQENVLRRLITDDISTWFDVTPIPSEPLIAKPVELDLQDSWRKAITQRPELIEKKLAVERQNVVIKYNRNQLFPEVDLTGTYGHSASAADFGRNVNDAANGIYPNYSYGVVVSVPLGNIGPRNAYKSAKAGLSQMVLDMKNQEQVILTQVDNDVKLVKSNLERVDATREARLYSEAALEAEQKLLESGKSTSFVVLQLQRDLTAARSSEIRALADYNITLDQLTLDEGGTLDKNRIDVKVR